MRTKGCNAPRSLQTETKPVAKQIYDKGKLINMEIGTGGNHVEHKRDVFSFAYSQHTTANYIPISNFIRKHQTWIEAVP